MKHFIVERDCYHGGTRYRKGQIVQFAEPPSTPDEKGKAVPVRHFVPIGAQSVAVETPIQQELHSLEQAIRLPRETLDAVYSDAGATSDRQKLDALQAVIRKTMAEGERKPAAKKAEASK